MTLPAARPAVTVLMSVYNGLSYLPQAVESILHQTLKDFVFLVIDDGSKDGASEYLDRIDDPRMRVVHQPNAGLAAALNRGIELCETEFLARMDADDIAAPDRLEAQLEFMLAHLQVGLVGTQITTLGDARSGRPSSLPTDHSRIYSELLLGHHAICHPTIMCRTEVLRRAGGYWAKGVAEDWDMFLRMGEQAELANLDRVMLSYRVHSSSLNGSQMSEVRQRIAYSCDAARRRAAGRQAITYQQFAAQQQRAPLWQRAGRAMDVYAMLQYRRAVAELLGNRPKLGYVRLAWAATCSPHLTRQRIVRVVRKRVFPTSRKTEASKNSGTKSPPAMAGV
jgi:glycosyltransferase involved in cell wall biosynthesis